MQATEQRAMIVKMISDLLDSQLKRMAMLDGPKANEMVYAFANGLTIGSMRRNGKGTAVGAMFGLWLAAPNHTFTNGNRERAVHMLRSKALRIEAEMVEQTIASLSAQLIAPPVVRSNPGNGSDVQSADI